MTDQYALQNPVSLYPQPPFKEQQQDGPGLAGRMSPRPDHGEATYRGSGRLAGRKALITGGDSGIGRATAIAFAREGADVAIVYLPAEEADAQETLAAMKDAGVKTLALPGDLTDEGFCSSVVEQTVYAFGGLDTLVNIAGKQQHNNDLLTLSTSQFDETFKTNVYAMFWLCKAALPHLPAGGSIINTASVQAYQPAAFLLDYAATKSAINAFTKALAAQLAPKGIRVNAVAPGPVWTPLEVAGGQPPENIPEMGGSEAPIGRPGQPAEMAPLYVFLASQESSYVSGSTLAGTGGMPTP